MLKDHTNDFEQQIIDNLRVMANCEPLISRENARNFPEINGNHCNKSFIEPEPRQKENNSELVHNFR